MEKGLFDIGPVIEITWFVPKDLKMVGNILGLCIKSLIKKIFCIQNGLYETL